MIDKSNYFNYLDDFIQGKLPARLEAEFVAFLEQNPGLASLSLPEKEEMLFPNKSSLKKKAPLHAKNIDEWLIAGIEGDLNASQQNELDAFLRINPAYKADQEKYTKTVLVPDASITYPFKSKLKKASVYHLYYRYASAAAVILFLSLWFLFEPEPSPTQFTDVQVKGETPVVVEEEKVPSSRPQELLVSAEESQPLNVNPTVEIRMVNYSAKRVRQAVAIESINPAGIKPSPAEPELIALNASSDLNPLPATLTLEPEEKTLTLLDYYYEEVRPKIPGSRKKAVEENLVKDVRGLVGSNIGDILHTVRNVRVVVAADK